MFYRTFFRAFKIFVQQKCIHVFVVYKVLFATFTVIINTEIQINNQYCQIHIAYLQV